jgi:hypothetical protein
MAGGRPRTLFFDIDYFQEIDSSEKAYWLGFIFGDGSIRDDKYDKNLKIHLAERDLVHVEKFCHDVRYPKKINSAMVTLSSKKMVEDLKNKGIRRNKTYRGGVPQNVPNKFLIDCARGLFDADGSISYHPNSITRLQAKLTTNKELLEWFKESTGLGNSIIPVKGKFHYEMRIRASKENFKVLYGSATRYLDRKHELVRPYIF